MCGSSCRRCRAATRRSWRLPARERGRWRASRSGSPGYPAGSPSSAPRCTCSTSRRSRATDARCWARSSAPDLLGRLDDEPELVDLLLDRERVALDGRGEAALRGEAELLEVDVLDRLLDPALEQVLRLEV